MPNWVTNRLTFDCTKEQFDDIVSKHCIEEADYSGQPALTLDFNTIIPTPDTIYQGNLGRKEREMHGADNWYDWSIENWGTKWNGCYGSVTREEMSIWFDTAWCAPRPVIDRLAEMYPDLPFTHEWADEDFGHNVGRIEYYLGSGGDDDVFEESDEAYVIASDLLGENDCFCVDEDGHWKRYECDTCPNRSKCFPKNELEQEAES